MAPHRAVTNGDDSPPGGAPSPRLDEKTERSIAKEARDAVALSRRITDLEDAVEAHRDESALRYNAIVHSLQSLHNQGEEVARGQVQIVQDLGSIARELSLLRSEDRSQRGKLDSVSSELDMTRAKLGAVEETAEDANERAKRAAALARKKAVISYAAQAAILFVGGMALRWIQDLLR